MPGKPDDDRPLSPVGQSEAATLAGHFVATGISFPRVWASPLTRAKQTAQEIVAAAQGDVSVTEVLRPDSDPVQVTNWLRQLENVEPIAVVGHQPLLGQVIEHL